MGALNEIIATSAAAYPPVRDIDGETMQPHDVETPDLSLFTANNANPEQQEDVT
jgi:hypothetical protein